MFRRLSDRLSGWWWDMSDDAKVFGWIFIHVAAIIGIIVYLAYRKADCAQQRCARGRPALVEKEGCMCVEELKR